MGYRIFSGIIAAGLLIAFVSPVVFKLKEVSLSAVVLIGLVLMLHDLWESLRQKDS